MRALPSKTDQVHGLLLVILLHFFICLFLRDYFALFVSLFRYGHGDSPYTTSLQLPNLYFNVEVRLFIFFFSFYFSYSYNGLLWHGLIYCSYGSVWICV